MVVGTNDANKRGWLARSGQRWKIYVFYACIVAGVVLLALLITAVNAVPAPPPEYPAVFGLGFVLVTGSGFAWLMLSVRCAKCRHRAAWGIVRTHAALEWLPALVNLDRCPNCNADQ